MPLIRCARTFRVLPNPLTLKRGRASLNSHEVYFSKGEVLMSRSQKTVLAFLAFCTVVLVVFRFAGVLEWRSVVMACVPLFVGALSVIYFGKNWKP